MRIASLAKFAFTALALNMTAYGNEARVDSVDAMAWHSVAPPDQSDWSAKRRVMFAAAKAEIEVDPRAVLKIANADIEAPVYPDSLRMALERGAVWITGTTEPGNKGNVVIAGHRDGYFRALESIDIGTRIQLRTATSTREYAVSEIEIVDALDLSPLANSEVPLLTLITCYPFRYEGYAPERYIVRARVVTH